MGGMPGEPPPSAPNTQCLAYSVDGGKTFKYYDKNPVLGHIAGLNRDPKVVWHAPTRKWIMALYLTGNDYWLFASPDMRTWEKICNLTLPGVTECPDLFPLSVNGDPAKTKWVFWGADGHYLVGSFDGRVFNPEGGMQKADYGVNFYAAQTWSDIPPADGRRIQIAWMAGGEYPGMPFSQQMSFPTEVTLRNTSDGLRLYRVPVREIAKLRQREHTWANVDLKPGDNPFAGLTGELFDIHAEFELGDSKVFGIRVRGEPVQYDVAAKTLSCRGKSAALSPKNGRIKLQILVDRTSVEVFGNDGRVVLASCFLPPDENTSLDMYAQEGNVKVISANVYPLKSIWSQPASKPEPAGNDR
jgi:fructan beta-fructosidase